MYMVLRWYLLDGLKCLCKFNYNLFVVLNRLRALAGIAEGIVFISGVEIAVEIKALATLETELVIVCCTGVT